MEEDIASLAESQRYWSSERKKEVPHQMDAKNTIVITEVGESSNNKEAEIDLDPRLPELEKKMGPVEDTIYVLVDECDQSRVLQVVSKLEVSFREQLIVFLRGNLNIFTRSHAYMVGIDPNMMCHRLNIDPLKKGMRQK